MPKGVIVALKPGKRAYATRTLGRDGAGWRAPKDLATAARDVLFDCDPSRLRPQGQARDPAIGAWWSKLTPPGRKARRSLPPLGDRHHPLRLRRASGLCAGKIVLHGEDFRRGTARPRLYADGPRWRIAWAQPIRGERPWSRIADD